MSHELREGVKPAPILIINPEETPETAMPSSAEMLRAFYDEGKRVQKVAVFFFKLIFNLGEGVGKNRNIFYRKK